MNLEQALSGPLRRWVCGVRRRPWRVVAVAVLGTGLALFAAFARLGIDSNTIELFPADLPARQNHDAFVALFPNLENALLIVVDGQTPELSRDAADRLVAQLGADEQNFEDVYLPGGGGFFERNALLYRSVDDLEELSDRLIELQPIVAELERDGSIANLAALVRQGLDRLDQDPQTVDLQQAALWTSLLDRIGQASVAVYRENPVAVSWEELMLSGSAIEAETRRVVVAHPVLDFAAAFPAAAPLAAVRAAVAQDGLDADHGLRVRVTGNPALVDEETKSVLFDIGVSGIFCLVLVAGILTAALRSVPLVAAVVTTLLVGLVWTAGFAALAVGDLNVISSAAGVLFLGLGVDYGIHFAMRYADLLRGGAAHGQALGETAGGVGPSLVLCTATTAVGFFAFLPTDYRGVAELGLITGVGLIIIFALTVTLLPALLSTGLRVDAARLHGRPLRFGAGPARVVERHAAAIRVAALGLGLAAAWLVPGLRFDANIVALRDPTTESVQTFNDLLADAGRSSPWYANSVAPDLASADRLKTKLRASDAVSRALTLSDYVPDDQDEKLEILADLAMWMDPGIPAEPRRESPLPVAEQVDALRDLVPVLAAAAPLARSEPLRASLLDLKAKLDGFLARVDQSEDPERALATLERVLLGSLPQQLDRLHRALSASSFGLDDLPPRLVARMRAADGRARVQIFPRENLAGHVAFTRFVEAVQAVDPHATGVSVNLVEFARTTQRAFAEALLLAVAVIASILFALWRRVDELLLVLAPLLLAALGTAAWMVVTGRSLNFFNVVVLPLLLGAGVDTGIHLVEQARRGRARDADVLGTTTARAAFFSALTTIASFGTLAFSSHRGLAGLGSLLTIGMALTVACNLVVLPALLAWRPRSAARTVSDGAARRAL